MGAKMMVHYQCDMCDLHQVREPTADRGYGPRYVELRAAPDYLWSAYLCAPCEQKLVDAIHGIARKKMPQPDTSHVDVTAPEEL